MSCEHLVCAACAGPVVEGRCPTCRAARMHMHREPGLMPVQLLLIALLVAVASMLLISSVAIP